MTQQHTLEITESNLEVSVTNKQSNHNTFSVGSRKWKFDLPIKQH